MKLHSVKLIHSALKPFLFSSCIFLIFSIASSCYKFTNLSTKLFIDFFLPQESRSSKSFPLSKPFSHYFSQSLNFLFATHESICEMKTLKNSCFNAFFQSRLHRVTTTRFITNAISCNSAAPNIEVLSIEWVPATIKPTNFCPGDTTIAELKNIEKKVSKNVELNKQGEEE